MIRWFPLRTRAAILVAVTGAVAAQSVSEPLSAERIDITEIELESRPFAELATTPGAVWVPIGADGTVVRLDPTTNEVVARVAVGDPMNGWRALDPLWVATEGDRVWVTQVAANAVARIDPTTNEIAQTVDLGVMPYALDVTPDAVWVVSFEESELLRVDPATGEVVARIDTATPSDVEATADAVWVVNHRNDRVTRVDPASNEVVAEISLGGPGPNPTCSLCARFVAVADDSVWVGHGVGQGRVARIDPATNELTETIAVTNDPRGMVVHDGAVWVVSTGPDFEGDSDDGALSRIDIVTHEVQGPVQIGENPLGIAVDENGALWIVDYTASVVLRVDVRP